MLRILLVLVLILIVVAAVIGSAASLTVNGGTLQIFSIPVTIEVPDCTQGVGYWKSHSDAWPVEEITVGGVAYTKAVAMSILDTASGGDATYILARQLIATKLNLLRGADASALGTTVSDADDWLSGHPLGSDPSESDRDDGITLAETLQQYNSGEIGPGSCDD